LDREDQSAEQARGVIPASMPAGEMLLCRDHGSRGPGFPATDSPQLWLVRERRADRVIGVVASEQFARGLQDRVGDRANVQVDAVEIA